MFRSERDGGVVVITLARPEKRNALDDVLLDELHRALIEAEIDDETRAVLLCADGPDFCAGADLAQLERIAESGDPFENLNDAHQIGDWLL